MDFGPAGVSSWAEHLRFVFVSIPTDSIPLPPLFPILGVTVLQREYGEMCCGTCFLWRIENWTFPHEENECDSVTGKIREISGRGHLEGCDVVPRRTRSRPPHPPETGPAAPNRSPISGVPSACRPPRSAHRVTGLAAEYPLRYLPEYLHSAGEVANLYSDLHSAHSN